MRDLDPDPVLPGYLTDLGHVVVVLEDLARHGSLPPAQGRVLRMWYDLLFAVWCWVRDKDYGALSAYLGRDGAAGELAWASLCEVVGHPLVMRGGRTFEAAVSAFPVTVLAEKGDIVGRFRLHPQRLPRIQAALSGMFECKRIWFLPELLPVRALRSLNYLDHLHLTERIVAGRALSALVRRPPTRVSPGAWSGLLVVWHDSHNVPAALCCPPEALARLQDALAEALPDGVDGQLVAKAGKAYLEAVYGRCAARRTAKRGVLTAPVESEIAC